MFKKLGSLGVVLAALAAVVITGGAWAANSNLIANASVEIGNATGSKPVGWSQDKWGRNSASFTYDKSAGQSSSRSLYVKMTKHTSGDAKWYFNHIAVKPNQSYTYTEFYKSNVATEIDTELISTTGKYSYTYLSSPEASPVDWRAQTVSFITPADVKTMTILHVIDKVGWLQTDGFSLVEDGSTPIPEPTPPTVNVTAPAANTTVSGSQTLSASATDSDDVVGVQFKIDNTNVGIEDTNAPYSVDWDSNTVTNGSHTVSAIARNTAGLSATASQTITVDNQIAPPPPPPPPPPASENLIANPSFETSSDGTTPDSWLSSNWGNNASNFSFLASGHTGGHSVKVEAKSYSSGAANWYYNDLPITAGKTYKYENWYKTNVETEVDAEVVMSNGSIQYYWLGSVPASSDWGKFSATFTAPAGAKAMAIYQILAKKGYAITDDYSLSEYVPQAFNRPLVSVTLDDGWASQYQNALPALNRYGLKATFYIISGELTDQPDYMSRTQIQSLYNQGMEIGSHTITHADLTKASQSQLVNELSQSQITLQNAIGAPVTNMAYPYGAYNATTISVAGQYYRSQRTVDQGYNTKDNFDITKLKIYEVDSDISQTQVQAWIDGVITQKAWLVLVYHEVGMSIGGDKYHVSTAGFDAQMAYLKDSGVAVVNVNQAIDEIIPQL